MKVERRFRLRCPLIGGMYIRVAVLLMMATLCNLGFAQRGFRRNMRRDAINAGVMGLFQSSAVQAELDLSRDEAEMIFALRDDLFSEYLLARRSDDQSSGLPTPDEVARNGNQLALRLLGVILKPKQMTRLNELWLQRQGVRALSDNSLADTLQLSDQQRAEIDKRVKQLSRDYGYGNLDDEDAKVVESIRDVLNEKQKKKWESLLGEAFSFRGFRRGRD